YNRMVRLAKPREQIQQILEKTRAAKRRAILARLLLLEPDQSVELTHLASEAGTTPATVRKLTRLGLITVTSEVDLPRLTRDMPQSPAGEKEITLNNDQQKVFDELRLRLGGGFSTNLLLGVTGS